MSDTKLGGEKKGERRRCKGCRCGPKPGRTLGASYCGIATLMLGGHWLRAWAAAYMRRTNCTKWEKLHRQSHTSLAREVGTVVGRHICHIWFSAQVQSKHYKVKYGISH